jgi:hypothetical protein
MGVNSCHKWNYDGLLQSINGCSPTVDSNHKWNNGGNRVRVEGSNFSLFLFATAVRPFVSFCKIEHFVQVEIIFKILFNYTFKMGFFNILNIK